MKSSSWNRRLFFTLATTTALACSSSKSSDSIFNGGGDDDASTLDATTGGASTDGGLGLGDDGGGLTLTNGGDGSSGFNPATFTLTPATITLDVTEAQPMPTIAFVAKDNNVPVNASFRIADRGELASIVLTTGVFSPLGSLGGTVTVAADYAGSTATATVIIHRSATQNGDPGAVTAAAAAGADAGADGGAPSVTYFGTGGYGGVGGDGTGGAVTAAQQAKLDAPSATSDGSAWLYPYDKTVFPRGVLAPLLQWSPGSSGDYDAVKIHLVESGYEYTGYFSKPALASIFNTHPIPQDVWTNIYNSYASTTGGEPLQVTVTVLAKGGAAAYALPTRTWQIAGGSLRGKIYYQSYGTHLATQAFQDVHGNPFGGATLAISPGAAAPDATAVAGFTSTDDSGCRVCHSVASNGSTLLTQNGIHYGVSSTFDLTHGNAETQVGMNVGSSYPALSPDGTVMFNNTTREGYQSQPFSTSSFYALPSGAAIPMAGLSTSLVAEFPTFSPDGTRVAYLDGTTQQLTTAAVDLVAHTFGTPATTFQPSAGNTYWSGTPYWPSFTPTNDGLVFEVEVQSNGRDTGGTRSRCDGADTNNCTDQGAHAELWYINIKTGKAHRLDTANGDGYLPSHPSAFVGTGYVGTDGGAPVDDRGKDAEFNYEPTVNPVVSGGYAWIVFTSRRLYGNVSTINPFHSDPRYVDISKVPTTKKLWVAAIDLSGDGSSDVSYPAFYLPGQELLAGNARGYWVVDPCQSDNTSCQTGDQCCGGYCQAAGDGGALICSAVKPMCAAQYDKCTTAADCCGTSLQCIGQRCSAPSVPGPR